MATTGSQAAKPTQPAQVPAFVQAQSEAMLELAKTLQTFHDSRAYANTAHPGIFRRLWNMV